MIIVDRGQRSGLTREELLGSVRVLGGLALASLAALLVGAVTG